MTDSLIDVIQKWSIDNGTAFVHSEAADLANRIRQHQAEQIRETCKQKCAPDAVECLCRDHPETMRAAIAAMGGGATQSSVQPSPASPSEISDNEPPTFEQLLRVYHRIESNFRHFEHMLYHYMNPPKPVSIKQVREKMLLSSYNDATIKEILDAAGVKHVD